MIRIGITPNFITTTGLVLNIVAAALFVYAGVYKSGELAYVEMCIRDRVIGTPGRTVVAHLLRKVILHKDFRKMKDAVGHGILVAYNAVSYTHLTVWLPTVARWH